MKLPKIKKSKSLEVDAIGVAVCIAISVFAYSCLIKPAIEQRSILNAKRQALAEQHQQERDLRLAAQRIDDELARLKDELAANKVRLEGADQVNGRVAKLTTAFGKCDLEVDDVRIGEVISGRRCDVVPITIAGRGGYRQCTSFLNELCKTFPDTSVAKLNLGGSPSRPDEPQKFSFELLWCTSARDTDIPQTGQTDVR